MIEISSWLKQHGYKVTARQLANLLHDDPRLIAHCAEQCGVGDYVTPETLPDLIEEIATWNPLPASPGYDAVLEYCWQNAAPQVPADGQAERDLG
jgi:hypothetical protein